MSLKPLANVNVTIAGVYNIDTASFTPMIETLYEGIHRHPGL